MEKLQDLSQSELQELLDNTERVESMALESDEIQNIQLEREMALASNRSLAEQNLDMKPRLEMQRDVLVERYSQLESVRDTYRQHSAMRDGIVGQVSPEALFSRLQTEGSNTEAESEALADEFLEGSLPLDSFLERFLSLRSLAHRRRVRVEKFQDVLRQRSESADPTIMTSSTCADQSQQQTAPAAADQQKQPPGHPAGPAHPSAGVGAPSSGMPYAPYPAAPSNPPPMPAAAAAAPANPPSQFPPYPSPGSPFTPTAGYHPPRAPACPYPTQPTFPAPHPGSAFGQYTPSQPQAGQAPYGASYSYGGYSYPAAPGYSNSHSPTGRPVYRPGYGVPQPYS